jgi:hypothetical protein
VKYDEPKRRGKAELEADLSSDNAATIATALTSAALHDPDRPYVESLIIKFIEHDDPWVRGVAALAAGHVARIHRQLAPEIVSLIESLLADERTSGKAQDALDDIRTFLGGRALD